MEHLNGCPKLFPKMPEIQGSFHDVCSLIKKSFKVRTDKARNEICSNYYPKSEIIF